MPRILIPDFDDDEDYQEIPVPETRPGEPTNLDEESLTIRRIWVSTFRAFVLSTTRKPSRYTPGPRWDIGEGRNKKPIWPRIAQFIRANQVIPEIFIAAQFRVGCDLPRPNWLLSQTALARYRTYLQQSPGNCALQLTVQVSRLKSLYYRCYREGVSETVVLREVLLDPEAELSPLFRYCQARLATGLDDVAAVFHAAALVQYLSNPDSYDESWGPDLIPSEIQAAANHTAVAGRVGR